MKKEDTIELINYITLVGKELVNKSGKIKDIGIKKQFLTEEDIRIERGIKDIISKMPGVSQFYAEEENDNFIEAESVWVADPISGTKLFIQGLKHYAIVASHMTKGKVDFSVVYDPSVDKLYTANKEEGVFINNSKINVPNTNKNRIIYAPSYGWKDLEQVEELRKNLEQKYEIYPSQGSFAINYCLVAEGLFDGVVSLTKDAFPEFAGCFIANEAGLKATNIYGNKDILPSDRVFVCGNKHNYNDLFETTKDVIDNVQRYSLIFT